MSEAIAKAFHEAYDRLAPSFGYDDDGDAVPWEEIVEQYRRLMIAVADEVVEPLEREIERLQAEITQTREDRDAGA